MMNNQSHKGCRRIEIGYKMKNQSNKDCKEMKIDHNQINIGVQQPLEMGCGINGLSKKDVGLTILPFITSQVTRIKKHDGEDTRLEFWF